MLARRLARHGLALSAGSLAGILSREAASAYVPAWVLSSTIKAASDFAAGQVAAAGLIPVHVTALADGVLKTMLLTKLKIATMVVMAVGMISLGATAISSRTPASRQHRATDDATKATQDLQNNAKRDEKRRADSAEKSEVAANPVTTVGTPELPDGKEKTGGGQNQRSEKRPEDVSGNPPRVRVLLLQRLEILKKRAEHTRQLYEQKAADQEVVWQADLRVYKAELDLCDATKDRIAILEKIARVHKVKEDHISRLVRQGAASSDVMLEAQLDRLEAEIVLEREKAKLAPPPK
jgi:hypothetical protein